MPPADILVIDEAHHARAETYQAVIDAYPGAIVIGLTATPCRRDGRGLGNIFDALVEAPQVAALIEQKALVPSRVYAPSTPDLDGVRVERGDYVESQLAERVNTAELVGDIGTHWLKLGERRPTVCFATGVEHSVAIRNEFRRLGVLAEHIDGGTPDRRTRRDLGGLAERRSRGGHERDGADRGLGLPGHRLPDPGAADQEPRPVPADDRPRAAAGAG